jgi:hypothetical protein
VAMATVAPGATVTGSPNFIPEMVMVADALTGALALLEAAAVLLSPYGLEAELPHALASAATAQSPVRMVMNFVIGFPIP